MRKSPQETHPESTQAKLAQAGRQGRRDRNKLIVMCVGLLLVVSAYAISALQGDRHDASQENLIGEEAPFVETVEVERFDMSAIADKILDNRPEDRVLLPTDVTEPVTNYVIGKNDAQFHALGVQDLTEERRATLEAAPAEHRGKPYRIRGKLEYIKERKRLDGKTEFRGWLRSEDGTATHFISMGLPEEVTLTGTLRFDGLFVKLFRAEGDEGQWVSGPLLVGARLVNSYAPLTAEDFAPQAIMASLNKIVDDTPRNATGLDGAVFNVQWQLLEYAKTDAYKAIDWEKDAVELNNETMAAILGDGAAWRFRKAGDPDPRLAPDADGHVAPLASDLIPIPIRLPISRNMGVNTVDAGENPAGVSTLTEGWVGNMGWTNQAGVLYFIMAGEHPDLLDRKEARLISGKGFFVKNHNYASKDRGTRTAPFFVFTELEPYYPVENPLAKNIMWGVLIVTLILLALFPLVLMRDKKKSAELQADLVRRKQARRRRLAAVDQGQA